MEKLRGVSKCFHCFMAIWIFVYELVGMDNVDCCMRVWKILSCLKFKKINIKTHNNFSRTLIENLTMPNAGLPCAVTWLGPPETVPGYESSEAPKRSFGAKTVHTGCRKVFFLLLCAILFSDPGKSCPCLVSRALLSPLCSSSLRGQVSKVPKDFPNQILNTCPLLGQALNTPDP